VQVAQEFIDLISTQRAFPKKKKKKTQEKWRGKCDHRLGLAS